MNGHDRSSLFRYVMAVSGAGFVAFAAFMVVGDLSPIWTKPGRFVLLLALLFIGEVKPVIMTRRGGQGGEISISTPFVFALLLTCGLPATLLGLAVSSTVTDVMRRKPWFKVTFNAGQYVLSLAGSAGVLYLVSSNRIFAFAGPQALGDLALVLGAGMVFFLLNNLFPAIAIALDQNIRAWSVLRRDFTYQTFSAGALVVTAPVVYVAADTSLLLLPILLLPALAVQWSTQMSLTNEWQSLHDSLTSLPNRTLFHQHVSESLAEGHPGAIMLVDLDHFKEVNDTLGHRTGDKLLIEVGARLQSELGTTATVARLGGDEFAMLIPHVDDDEALAVAERVRSSLHTPFVVEAFMLSVEASIGVAVYPHDGEDSGTLLRCADVAMYVAKESRKGCERYTPERDQHSRHRLALMGQVPGAIAGRQLILHYQPKLDLHTGRIVGAEALVRWQHPHLGLLPPGDFVPLIERTVHIAPFTYHVIEVALEQLALWQERGIDLRLAVNVSVSNLLDSGFAPRVEELIKAAGVDGSLLEMEITESTIMADPARAMSVLEELAALGISLSIDDFGTGYSSLSYLKQLPVDTIKIDRSFVMNMATDADDERIVQSTVGLAKNLGLTTVAEGVEDIVALEMLRSLGCDLAQGYFIARALPPEALLEFIDTSRPSVLAN
jgi:diguanylate cyclase (GGDEF)-like protein